MAQWSRLIVSWPLVRWFATTGDIRAMTLHRVPTGLVDAAAAEGLDLVRGFGLGQQLSMPLSFTQDGWEAIVIGRAGDDWSDADVALARQIQTLLRLLHRRSAWRRVSWLRPGCRRTRTARRPRVRRVVGVVPGWTGPGSGGPRPSSPGLDG